MRVSRLARAFAATTLAVAAAAFSFNAEARSAPTLKLAPVFSPFAPMGGEIIATLRSSERVEGDLELGDTMMGGITHRQRVTIEADVPRVVHIPVSAAVSGAHRVSFVVGNKPEASETLALDNRGNQLLVSERELDLPRPRRSNGVEESGVMVSEIGPELPVYPTSYDEAVMVVLRSSTVASASAPACNALRTWVRNGGTLYLVDDSNNGIATWRGNCGDVEPAAGMVGTINPKSLRSGNAADYLATLLEATQQRNGRQRVNLDPSRLGRENTQTRVSLAALVLLGFAVAGGPLLFRRLRRRQQMERVVTLLPVMSGGAFVLLLGLGTFMHSGRETRTIIVRELVTGETASHDIVARGFIHPEANLHVHRALPGSVLTDSSYDWRLDRRGAFHMEGYDDIVLNEGDEFPDYVYTIETGESRLAGPITLACNRIECAITNRSGAPLVDSLLTVGGVGFASVGNIADGASITVKVGSSDLRALEEPHPAPDDREGLRTADLLRDAGQYRASPTTAVLAAWHKSAGAPAYAALTVFTNVTPTSQAETRRYR